MLAEYNHEITLEAYITDCLRGLIGKDNIQRYYDAVNKKSPSKHTVNNAKPMTVQETVNFIFEGIV